MEQKANSLMLPIAKKQLRYLLFPCHACKFSIVHMYSLLIFSSTPITRFSGTLLFEAQLWFLVHNEIRAITVSVFVDKYSLFQPPTTTKRPILPSETSGVPTFLMYQETFLSALLQEVNYNLLRLLWYSKVPSRKIAFRVLL